MNLRRDKLRIIISGGGTGGHIFPAIAIANALKKLNSENEILFVGALGRMEMEKIPAAGYKIEGLEISGIQRSLTPKNLLLPVKILKSILKAKKIIKKFNPDVAVGVGGYASGPLLYAASKMKIPSLIQEQNSYAGITNRILGKGVQKVCVAYEGMEKYFSKEKIILTGNPVREEATIITGKKEEAFKFFGLDSTKKTILVIGGSLGARTINESIANSLNEIEKKGYQLIWQTGKSYSEKAKKLISVQNNHSNQIITGLKSFDFIQRMDLAYAAADIIISRAGASSVSELTFIGKPVVLIPSPNVAEDHQTKNAQALVAKDAALHVSDAVAKSELMMTAFSLLNDESRMKTLSHNISQMAMKDSAGKIAEEIYKLALSNVEGLTQKN